MTAKQQRSIKTTAVQRPGQIGQHLEHTEIFDDNLLPDACEIECLHKIDPTILDWLKERAAKEQEFRHSAYSQKLTVFNGQGKREHHLNLLGMTFAFILMILGFGISAFLIYLKYVITGTIFTGTTLVLIAATFITRNLPKKPNQAK
jgi:uncharacterized membrane protein